jgi:hypothetical protein
LREGVNEVELKDLVGTHELGGVDLIDPKISGEDAQRCCFVLDGVTYVCQENPSDGYRSYMDEIEITDQPISNLFAPQTMLCSMEDPGPDKSDVLVMRDLVTGKEVLRVGTENTDDYYPYCVLQFSPQNMACNGESAKDSP